MFILYVALVLLAVYVLFKRRRNDDGKICPGPAGLPLVGNALQFNSTNMHFKLSEWAYQFGPIYEITVLGQRIIVLNDDQLVRKAMSNETFRGVFAGRQKHFYGEYVMYNSESMSMTNDIDLNSELRKTFVKGMHIYGTGIKAFEDLVTTELTLMTDKMKKYEGEDFDPGDLIRVGLGNVTSVLLIGSRINDTDVADDMFWEFTRASDAMMNPNISQISTALPFLRFLPGPIGRYYLQVETVKRQLIDKYVTKVKETFDERKTRGLLDVLVKSQYDDVKAGREVLYTDKRILNAVLEIILGGINTSVATLRSVVLCMIHDQERQEKLYREILEVIGPDTPPTLDVRSKMPYTEAVIHESLRYLTPAPLSFPNTVKKDVNFEGYKIYTGDLVITNLWHLQHEESVWKDPFVFRPERFLDVDGEMLPPSHVLRRSWHPFGIGKRQCIGESLASSRLFLFICTLFQKYRFLPPEEGECISSDPRTYTLMSILHPDKFKCRIQTR